MMIHREKSYAELLDPELQDRITSFTEKANFLGYDGFSERDFDTTIYPKTETTSQVIVLDPRGDVDETHTTVLCLANQSGWSSVNQQIRARALQAVQCPNSRLIILPTNSKGQDAYNVDKFFDEQTLLEPHGDNRLFAEQQMSTLEMLGTHYELGKISLTGYSQGGRTSMAMARVGSNKIEVTKVNADESPSKVDRRITGLMLDFMKSGGDKDIVAAVEDSGLEALKVEASGDLLYKLGLLKFGAKQFMPTGLTELHKMSGSMYEDARAVRIPVETKIGYIAGSKLFDPKSSKNPLFAYVVKYSGNEFRHKHATGDNPFAHALMAVDGLGYRN